MNKIHFRSAYCSNKQLVHKISDVFKVNIHDNTIYVSVIHECCINDSSLFNELKPYLKCPYCKKVNLTYCNYGKNYGYLRTHIKETKYHFKVCKYFHDNYEKEASRVSSTTTLKDSHKVTQKNITNIFHRILANNIHKKDTHNHKSSNDGINDIPIDSVQVASAPRHAKQSNNRIRILKWEYRLNRKFDKNEICTFYGDTKSITIKYPEYHPKKYKDDITYYGDKRIFLIKFDNGLIRKPSYILNWYKDESDIPKHDDNGKEYDNKYFMIMCQVIFKKGYKWPFFDIIFNKNKGIGPAIYPKL